MVESRLEPATRSANHLPGEPATGTYVLRGKPVFVLPEGNEDFRIETGPGEYVFDLTDVAHREENPSITEEAYVNLAWSTQEEMTVNLFGDV